jgi:hypothetical protein
MAKTNITNFVGIPCDGGGRASAVTTLDRVY